MYQSIENAKKQLQIDDDYDEDDLYIEQLIEVAEDAVAHHLGYQLSVLEDEHGLIPASVSHGILLLVANLYANREPVSNYNAVKIPYTLEYLLGMYKYYSVP